MNKLIQIYILILLILIIFIKYNIIDFDQKNLTIFNIILIIISLIIIVKYIENKYKEQFTTSFENSSDIIRNLSSVYNDGTLKVNNIKVLNNLEVDGKTTLNKSLLVNGNLDVDDKLNVKGILTADNNLKVKKRFSC